MFKKIDIKIDYFTTEIHRKDQIEILELKNLNEKYKRCLITDHT